MSTEKDFDWHLGAIVEGLALPHGGRTFLIGLMPWSKNTLIRRIKGESGFTVSELEIVARALNTTPYEIVSQALRNYGGTEEVAVQKLMAASGANLVSDAPASFEEHKMKKLDPVIDYESEQKQAAIKDEELAQDEHDAP